MVIRETLDENRAHLLSYRQELVARYLAIPRGAVKCKTIRGQEYIYLQRREGGAVKDEYLGKPEEDQVKAVLSLIAKRKEILSELKTVKESLRGLALTIREVSRQDFTPELREFFLEMGEAGLWEAGLEIVGSWCFTFYQQYYGVQDFPVRTLDLDIVVPLPYRGPKKDISALLRKLGFEERYHYDSGTVTYIKSGYEIELLGPERGRGGVRADVEPLRVNAQLLRFMDLLLDNKIYVTVTGVGKVAIPSMPAFFLHKLLIAPRRTQLHKQQKDLRQAWEVAKALWADDPLAERTKTLIRKELHPSWRKTIETKSIPLLNTHVVRDQKHLSAVLQRIGLHEESGSEEIDNPQQF
ncbi:MAG: GSU2403 family nucleotidyltransferase fold protein [Desulfovibrionales bacterium]